MRRPRRAIIFVDIDGVLNTYRHLKSQQRHTGTCSPHNWCPIACGNLMHLCRLFRAKIVVSSSWRCAHSLQELQRFFASNGIPAALVIDATPTVVDIQHVWSDFGGDYCRGHEIKDWLLAHDPDCNYLILDDDADMLPEHNERFIRVDSEIGFADQQAFNQAITILDHECKLQA